MTPAEKAMAEWLKTRPLAVQERARQFPPMSKFDDTRWVLGYEECKDGGVGLAVTTIPPEQAYERYGEMVATKEHVCPNHLPEADAERKL